EGYLPPGKVQQSFIPFDVRNIVGLPTYKDRDAIAAYHFYRLLKSTKNITLIYITEAKGIEKSEKSRFIDQILIEYAEKNKNAQINQQIIDFSFETQAVKEISIQKSEKMMDILARKSYSASSLLTYLTCSLQFYFTYILRLKEEEEVYESPDYRLIGEIVHKTLQELYQPYCGRDQTISLKEIDGIKNNIEEKLIKTFKEKLKTDDIQTGRNRIAYEVLKRFLDSFFEKEKQNSGFKILMLEQKIEDVDFRFSLNGKEHQVKLEGTIDRLDVQDGIYRVIDYKTGKTGSLNLKSAEELPGLLSGQEAVNRKEVFQLFFYLYLLKQDGKLAGDSRLGIYPFKKMYDDLKFVKIDKSDIIGEDLVEQYEGILKGIFRELFNLEVPFVQTGEEKNCQYCPYQSICSRETGQSYSS
ncbi:MAG: PD-(D/E)XK nuclease family protein, partial [Candidatus Aminicenantes bacterium]